MLQDIERAAGAPFRDLDMAAVAEDPPLPITALAAFARGGRAWVYTDEQDRPAAYLLLEIVDGDAHVEQVSVHPDHARRGIGAALLEVAAEWARASDLPALTLTTFANVPWNAPYYARLGFEVIPAGHLGPGLRRLRSTEAAHGLDRWPRVAMRRPLR